MATLLADNAYGTLGSGLTATATTLNFTSGHGARFPTVTAPDVLYCCILNSSNILEEVIITAHTANADSCTITRASGGTTAKVWLTGDRIEARLSSSSITALFAGPPPIGGTAPAAGSFTTLTTTGNITPTLSSKTTPVAADGIVIVDSAAGGIEKEVLFSNLAASATPLADGTGAVGTSIAYARQDHVHPKALTFSNVTASRALATTYTNSSGHEIWVSVWSAAFPASVASATLTVNGIAVNYCQLGTAGAGTAGVVMVSGPVPNGATYRVDMAVAGIATWIEYT